MVWVSGAQTRCGDSDCPKPDAGFVNVREHWDAREQIIVGSHDCATCGQGHLYTRKATADERARLTHDQQLVQPKGFCTMFDPRRPFYIKGIVPKTETVDGETRKRVELELLCQPFSSEMAKALEIAGNLFTKGSGDPIDDLVKCELKIAVPLQKMSIAMAPDTEGALIIENVRFADTVKVRVDKESPVLAATFYVDFAYPTPEDLLSLFSAYLEQRFFTFETQQGSLYDEKAAGADQPRRGRRRKSESEPELPAAEEAPAAPTVN